MEKHLLYNEIFIGTMPGMLLKSVPIGEIPPSGKRLYLSGGDVLTDYYTYFPGSGVTSFRNGGAVLTPREGMSRIFYIPGEGYILAVNRGTISTGVITLPLLRYPVVFKSGREFTLDVQGTIQAELNCTDSRELARCFIEDGMSDPLARVSTALSSAALSHIRTALDNSLAECAPVAALNVATNASMDADPIFCTVQTQFKWLDIPTVTMNFEVVNANELISYSNEMYEENKELRRTLTKVMIDLATRSMISPEVSQIMQTYLSMGMISPDPHEFINLTNQVIEMANRFSGRELISQLKMMGLMPATTRGLLT